jgi:hypothetical protein
VVAFDQITPQARRFLARRTERVPFSRCFGQPLYFYRAITHAERIAWYRRDSNGKQTLVGPSSPRSLLARLRWRRAAPPPFTPTQPLTRSRWSTASEIGRETRQGQSLVTSAPSPGLQSGDDYPSSHTVVRSNDSRAVCTSPLTFAWYTIGARSCTIGTKAASSMRSRFACR